MLYSARVLCILLHVQCIRTISTKLFCIKSRAGCLSPLGDPRPACRQSARGPDPGKQLLLWGTLATLFASGGSQNCCGKFSCLFKTRSRSIPPLCLKAPCARLRHLHGTEAATNSSFLQRACIPQTRLLSGSTINTTLLRAPQVANTCRPQAQAAIYKDSKHVMGHACEGTLWFRQSSPPP